MKASKVIWGVLAVVCGILLLLSSLGIGDQLGLVRLVGSILLVGLALTGLYQLRFFLGITPLALLLYIWREPLGLDKLDFWLLLFAALIISLGLSVLFQKKGRIFRIRRRHQLNHVEELTDEEEVNISSSFGEQIKYIKSAYLKKINISSNFSSVRIYLEECNPTTPHLLVKINANFAGIVLNIPRSWQVDSQMRSFAGEVNDSQGGATEDGCKIVLEGGINFGEVKIVRV